MNDPDRKFWFITPSQKKFIIYAKDEIEAINIFVEQSPNEAFEKMFEDFE